MIFFGVSSVDAPYGRAQQRSAAADAVAVALQRAGSPVRVVGRRDDGVPVFPAPFVGSVTHTAELAVAITARGAAGVGIDVETRDVDARAGRILLDDEERGTWGQRLGPCELRTLFVAKEASFKALSAAYERQVEPFWRVRLKRTSSGTVGVSGEFSARVWARGCQRFAFAVAITPAVSRCTVRPSVIHHRTPAR